MELNVKDWKEYQIDKLFKVVLSKGDIKEDDIDAGNVRLVSSGETNNGIVTHIDSKGDGKAEIFEGNVITADMFCNAYYQDEPFFAVSHGRVNILLPKFKLNSFIGLFISTIINNEKYKYSYGRALYSNVVSSMVIKLPTHIDKDRGEYTIDENRTYSDEGYIPDWQFMEDYIKSLHHKPITTKVKTGNMPKLNLQSWQWFSMSKLFDIKKGKRLTSADQEEGSNNYVGAIDSNNGIANHIGQAPIHKANTISLSYNGSVGEAFYQSEPYWATDDVNALYSKYDGFNKQIGLFMVTVIRQEKYKFSYGRKWTLDNMNKTEIKLPIQRDNKGNPIIDDNHTYSDKGYIPDWQFMEDYINSLPYSDRIS